VFNISLLIAVGCTVLLCPQRSFAQVLHGDTSMNKWFNSIVRVQSVYKSRTVPVIRDTLIGTAFLVTDDNKLYLVTAKHLIQADLYGKDQHTANDSVSLRIKLSQTDILIRGLSAPAADRSAVVFSDDEEDIAIISLQKSAYKNIAANLLAHVRPIPSELIDISNNHQPGELCLDFGFDDYLSPKKFNGVFLRVRGVGVKTSKIDQISPSAGFFSIGSTDRVILQIVPGNSGSPVVSNNKLIGLLSNPIEIANNHDALQNAYYSLHTGRVTKSFRIVESLKELQKREKQSGFDN